MPNDSAVLDAPAPAIAEEPPARWKKEDTKGPVVERFTIALEPRSSTAARKTRSPYWQPIDEEC